jgi:hypothetical protein
MVDAVELAVGDCRGVDHAREEVTSGHGDRVVATQEARDVIVAEGRIPVEGVATDERRRDAV